MGGGEQFAGSIFAVLAHSIDTYPRASIVEPELGSRIADVESKKHEKGKRVKGEVSVATTRGASPDIGGM